MGIAQEVDEAIDMLTNTFVSEKSAAFCAALTPIALAGITIYLMTLGFSIARGEVQAPVQQSLAKSFRIALVTGIALNAGVYQDVIIASFQGIEGAILSIVSGSPAFAAGIDNLDAPFIELGQKLWGEATTGFWPAFGLLAAASVVSITQSLLFSVGLGLYLLAKIAQDITLAVGPLYIFLALWPSTEKFFESWLGQTLNFIVLKVLIAAIFTLLTAIASQFAAHISSDIDAVNVMNAALALVLCCGALVIVMLFLPQIASALAGGASITGIGRTVARFMIDYLHSPSSKRPAAPRPPASSIGNSSPDRHTAIPRTTPLYQRNTLSRLHSRA